jgi:hypothetical protein
MKAGGSELPERVLEVRGRLRSIDQPCMSIFQLPLRAEDHAVKLFV